MEISKEFKDKLVKSLGERLRERLGDSIHIIVEEKVHNNGQKEPAMYIRKDGSDQIAICGLEKIYRSYCDNPRDLESISNSIVEDFMESGRIEHVKKKVTCYQSVREQLQFKLINAAANRERLQLLPHIRYMDLAIIFYVLVESDSEDYLTLEVTRDLLGTWGVNINDIYKDAFRNMEKEAVPPLPMNMVMRDLFQKEYEDGDIKLEEFLAELQHLKRKEDEMYVLTNQRSLHGACRLLDIDALQQLSDKLESSMYLIPSSLHEILLFSTKSRMKLDEIEIMIREINQSDVEVQDRLSNSVYLFDRELGSVRMIREGEPL